MTDFIATRGDTFLRSATIPKLDGSGDPFDLTGCRVEWTLTHFYDLLDDDPLPVVALSWHDNGPVDGIVANGITVGDPTTGVVTLRIAPDVTALLIDVSAYRWRLRVTDTAGEVTTVDRGTLRFDPP